MKLLLLGATDLTLAVAEALAGMGMTPAGVLSVGRTFRISYQPEPVRNVRWVDLAGWCTDAGAAYAAYDTPACISRLAAAVGAEACLVAGWYHMVPAAQRRLFPRGCFGLHASLLPAYRGGAPLNWALINGESETGVSLFELGDGSDDGPIHGQRRFAIADGDYIGDLLARAEAAAIDLLRDCLPEIAAGRRRPRLQTGSPSYGLQRRPEDGRIDWRRSAEEIYRLIRATSRPYPGAFSHLDGDRVVIWRAAPRPDAATVWGAPGQIVLLPGSAEPLVVTGRGLLAIEAAEDPDGGSLDDRLRRSSQRRFDPGP